MAASGLNQAEISAQLSREIADLGQRMQAVSRDYEALFPGFQRVADALADAAPSQSQAALDIANTTEAAAAAFRGNMPNQQKLDCVVSCSACCHLYVKMPPGFAELIADYVVEHFSADELEALTNRLQQAAAKEQAVGEDLTAYRNPCPMLADDLSCQIYPVRPLSCRSFSSSSRPRCEAMVFDNQRDIKIDQEPSVVGMYGIATNALEKRAERQGLSADQQTLSVAVLEALSDRL